MPRKTAASPRQAGRPNTGVTASGAHVARSLRFLPRSRRQGEVYNFRIVKEQSACEHSWPEPLPPQRSHRAAKIHTMMA